MAIIGSALTSPEAGWRRYDDMDSRIARIGTDWTYSTNASMYNGGVTYSDIGSPERSIKFKFKGTNLRILTAIYSTTILTDLVTVKIDSVISGTFKQNDASAPQGVYQCLVFEKTGLANVIHIVELICNEKQFYIDCIDIDSTGYLVHPILTQRSNISDMEIGDCIPCKYTAATIGVAGTFSEFGTCIANEIPVTGTATPNGLFYFIKNEKGMLIADRIIQINISWDTLNTAKYVQGNSLMTDTDTVIASPSVYGGSGTYSKIAKNNINFNSATNGSYYTGGTILAQSTGIMDFEFVVSRITNNAFFYLQLIHGGQILQFGILPNNILGYNTDGSAKVLLAGNPTNKIFRGRLNRLTNTTSYFENGKVVEFPSLIVANPNSNCIAFVFQTNSNAIQNISFSHFNISSPSNISAGIFTVPKGLTIRSLSSGNSYLGTDDKPSLTDKNIGVHPINNEWDKCISNNTMGGKITEGDPAIWNHSTIYTYAKDTPAINLSRSADSLKAINTYKCMRAQPYPSTLWGAIGPAANASSAGGFRPVLEYPDSPKCTNVWY